MPGCSTALITKRWWPLALPSNKAPSTAMWLASVAPLVNTSSAPWQPRKVATRALASVSARRAAWPGTWVEDGLAQTMRKLSVISSMTSLAGWVVALWSR